MSIRKPAPYMKRGSLPARRLTPISVPKEPTQAEEVGLVQGKKVDSVQEWWVARALWKMKLSFQYQYSVFGGSTRGGYFIDFVVYTAPLWTMIEIYSNHWHTQELGADDRRRQVEIEAAMSDVARIPMTILWADQLTDEEHAYEAVRRELR